MMSGERSVRFLQVKDRRFQKEEMHEFVEWKGAQRSWKGVVEVNGDYIVK